MSNITIWAVERSINHSDWSSQRPTGWTDTGHIPKRFEGIDWNILQCSKASQHDADVALVMYLDHFNSSNFGVIDGRDRIVSGQQFHWTERMEFAQRGVGTDPSAVHHLDDYPCAVRYMLCNSGVILMEKFYKSLTREMAVKFYMSITGTTNGKSLTLPFRVLPPSQSTFVSHNHKEEGLIQWMN